MACSSISNSSQSDDLYRDRFKYFKSYGSASSSPKLIRKLKDAKLPTSGKGDKQNGEKSCIVTDESEERERVAGGRVLGDVEEVLLRHPQDKDSDFMGKVFHRTINYGDDSTKNCQCYEMWGLRSPRTWTVVELTFPSGLIVIRNPFTPAGQRYWISRTMLDFPHHPHYITNMDNLNRLEKKKRGELVDNLENFKLDICGLDFYQKLRWVTFGYHHDWDTKVYTEEKRSNFPEDLADMTKYISQILGFSYFEAEAAIANYYHMDSTLSGHVDRSEVNQYAPLFSLSFGQTAIFLIGGKTKSEAPQPVLLQSGDIAIMSGESRLSYHGVPKILPANTTPWDDEPANVIHSCKSPMTTMSYDAGNNDNSCKRLKLDDNFNINRTRNDSSVSTVDCVHNCKTFVANLKDSEAGARLNALSWTMFLNNYINKSRINLNIRQVLFPGQCDLYSKDRFTS